MPMRSELRIPRVADTGDWSGPSSSRQSIDERSQDRDFKLILLIVAVGVLLALLPVRLVPLPPDLVGAFALS